MNQIKRKLYFSHPVLTRVRKVTYEPSITTYFITFLIFKHATYFRC